jgi:hypothetical protein
MENQQGVNLAFGSMRNKDDEVAVQADIHQEASPSLASIGRYEH